MKRIIFICMAICMIANVAYAQKKAVIAVEKATHDFGKIKESAGEVTHAFTLLNKGGKPLVVTRVVASCGCTTPTWNKEPIKPGGSTSLSITFDPEYRVGPFVKTIAVYSNGKTGSFILTIRGEVIE